MAVPDRIPIVYEPGDQTGSVGAFADGYFLGGIALVRVPDSAAGTARPARWVAIMHLFDTDGAHLSSDIWDAGEHEPGRTAAPDRARDRLDAFVRNLPGAHVQHIAVRPFRVVHDGVTYGLIAASDPAYGEWVDLVPQGLRFHEPWDGEYDT